MSLDNSFVLSIVERLDFDPFKDSVNEYLYAGNEYLIRSNTRVIGLVYMPPGHITSLVDRGWNIYFFNKKKKIFLKMNKMLKN